MREVLFILFCCSSYAMENRETIQQRFAKAYPAWVMKHIKESQCCIPKKENYKNGAPIAFDVCTKKSFFDAATQQLYIKVIQIVEEVSDHATIHHDEYEEEGFIVIDYRKGYSPGKSYETYRIRDYVGRIDPWLQYKNDILKIIDPQDSFKDAVKILSYDCKHLAVIQALKKDFCVKVFYVPDLVVPVAKAKDLFFHFK